MHAFRPRRAQFSSYSFDFQTGEITRYGTRLRLETQPAKVLELLLDANGALVSRTDLIAVLWPDEKEGDFDRRLDKAVAKLRATLNDEPGSPRFVETLKGRGYRFVAEFSIVSDEGFCGEEDQTPQKDAILPPASFQAPLPAPESLPVAPEEPRVDVVEPAPPARWLTIPNRPSTWIAAGVIASVLLSLSAIAWWRSSRFAVHPRKAPVVLILGFQDTSQSTENAWISHAIGDWLSGDLRADDDLQVVSSGDSPILRARAAALGCSDLPASVSEAARQYVNANIVIFGSYSVFDDGASGERWRLDVCLGKTDGKQPPQSLSVVGTKDDIPQLVFDAGTLIRSKLGLRSMSRRSIGYLRATLPSNLAAARLYTEGTLALRNYQPQEASALLADAVKLEPQHAAAHAALSAAWAALGYMDKSRQEAIAAENLAKNLSPVQQLEYRGLVDETAPDWRSAADIYSQLLQLYPRDTDYLLKLANALTNASAGSEALRRIKVYRVTDPAANQDPRVNLAEASADAAIGNYPAELAAALKAEREASQEGAEILVADARMRQGDAYDKLDNWQEAPRLWRLAGQTYESIGNRDGMAKALTREGDLAWRRGQMTDAEQLVQQALSLSKASGDQTGIADSLARLGVFRLYVREADETGPAAAGEFFRQAADIYRKTGNAAEEANVLSLFGDAEMTRCRFEEAKGYYSKALAISRMAGDKSRIANRLLDLGIVAESEGHLPEAEQNFLQSVSAYTQLGQADRVAIVKERIGEVLYREGRVNEAATDFEEVLGQFRAIGRTVQALQVSGELVRLEILQDPAHAVALAQQNVRDAAPNSKTDPNGTAGEYADLAEAEAQLGNCHAAEDANRHTVTLENSLHPDFLPRILLARGYVNLCERKYAEATATFRRSLNVAHSQGQPYWELNARLALGEADVLRQGKSALPELLRLKSESASKGYGIFPLQIDAFLHSSHDRQPSA